MVKPFVIELTRHIELSAVEAQLLLAFDQEARGRQTKSR
jgi:hypothetical protein